MAYEVIMPYHLHMPLYFVGTFTEYPYVISRRSHLYLILYFILHILFKILSITQFVSVALSPSQLQIDLPSRWSTTA